MKKDAFDYLKDFLRVAPLSHALWRACEALSFGNLDFEQPVLDIGCGFGEFAGVVFNQVEMGVDINSSELERALAGKKYKKVAWADARKLPFKDKTYKTVVSVSVLEHIENAELAVSEIYRVLKPGGIFVFSVPTTKMRDELIVPKILYFLGIKKWGDKYFDLHKRAFRHVNLKSSRWWMNSLTNVGFEIMEKHGTLSPNLLRLHELFLITALPSQFWKLFFGERLIMSAGVRSAILPHFFSRFIFTDRDSSINMFFIARKK